MSTTIEWTDESWNPIVGCEIAGPGCTNCYAMRMAHRLGRNPATPQYAGLTEMVNGNAVWTGEARLVEHKLDDPMHWRRGRAVFVDSMGDLFEGKDAWLDQVFEVMEATPRHTYQTLTKRSERMRDYLCRRYGTRPAPGHMWFGVSVENADYCWRIDDLRAAPAAVRFLSIEPLIGDVGELDLTGIHWVIAGGESGPGFRPLRIEWIRSVRDQCVAHGVPFFFKQWGGLHPKSGGRTLDGRQWCEWPHRQ
jgi:protein gp37